MFQSFLLHALVLVVVASGAPLVAGSLSGLVVSIIQAATQVQEQTTAFLVRIVSLAASLVLVGPWAFDESKRLIEESMRLLVLLGKP